MDKKELYYRDLASLRNSQVLTLTIIDVIYCDCNKTYINDTNGFVLNYFSGKKPKVIVISKSDSGIFYTINIYDDIKKITTRNISENFVQSNITYWLIDLKCNYTELNSKIIEILKLHIN